MARKSAQSADRKTTKSPAKKAAPKASPARLKAASDAPSAPSRTGRSLVIVESPKKATAINTFLGSGYVVKASMGHVRDLPKRTLGLDVIRGYAPSYEIMAAKKDTIADLKREAAKAETIYLATDPDREGEAIAWHLQEALDL
ncbi:MAG TPA: toprim domain-containing protein, partial [Isosphaeraceae bacterium]